MAVAEVAAMVRQTVTLAAEAHNSVEWGRSVRRSLFGDDEARSGAAMLVGRLFDKRL